MNELPKQITQKLWIGLREHSRKPCLMVCDMSEYGETMLGTIDVTVDVPDDLRDPRQAQIDSLHKKRERITSESTRQLAEIDDQIKSLQAIEYDGGKS